MMSDAEDSNETLFYIQDIFASGDENINRALTNSLLHYAYLPTVVQSLFTLKHKPQLSLNTCLYVLTQTFRIIREQTFVNILFSALFLPKLPAKIQQYIEKIPKNPSSYALKFTHTHLKYYSLSQYLEEYYNLNNLDVFLLYGSQNLEFMNEIKEEYEMKIGNLIITGPAVKQTLSTEQNTEYNNDSQVQVQDEEPFVEVQQLEELKNEIESQNNQNEISQVIEGTAQIQINTLIEVSNNQNLKNEEIRDKLHELFFKRISEKDMVRIMEEHQRMSFGLGILVGLTGKGGLIMSAQYNKELNPEIINQVPEICPYKFKKQSNQDSEEEEKVSSTNTNHLIGLILDVFYFQYITLNSIYQIKRIIYQIDPDNGTNDPYYYFIETFQREIQRFQPIDSNMEFNRLLAQPLLMCPFLTEELQQKIPQQLHMPCIDDETINQNLLIQDFILKRFLLYKFTPDLAIDSLNYDMITKIDYGFISTLKEGAQIIPLPQDRVYQICYQRTPGKSRLDQLYIMQDEQYFVLIRPNVVSPTHIRGYLFLKRKFKQILETMLDKTDTRNLFIAYTKDELSSSCNDDYQELNIYFEDWRKSLDIREKQIEGKRRKQIVWEKDLVEKFLVDQCESEINNLFGQQQFQ
ncbi:UNKNOWN [Stylonychia lemnae]|uniref:CLEC16A/TT9 C-terminal domain-containing protein n=1 Tax=Stylonychia lemnae TaxID=5949 RepID=A0A078B9S9_STYLE|nr:UNKNOWN [Stylonychia lemnae]|eukprot:CDW90017.1 UNKNOWN [Stylonychia lemnae]